MDDLLVFAIVGVTAAWTARLLWRQVAGKGAACCGPRQCRQCSASEETRPIVTTIIALAKGAKPSEPPADE